jgi:hypothetical protein
MNFRSDQGERERPITEADRRWADTVRKAEDERAKRLADWDGIDDLMMVRYRAGRCSEAERLKVENARKTNPRVKACLDLVDEVLGEE